MEEVAHQSETRGDTVEEESSDDIREESSCFTEGQTVFVVTGRNSLMNSICLYAFDSREAAELWANDGRLNDSEKWVINEMPLRSMVGGA